MLLTRLNQAIADWLNKEKPAPRFPLSHFERVRHEIKPCDVILVEGRSRVSDVIRMISQSTWTHAALYIGRLHDIEDPKFRAKVAHHYHGDPDQQLIIESLLGQGVIIKPLTTYQQDHLRICRPRGLSYRDSQQAINFAISRLGLDYDLRQILDLARFLIPWSIFPRRWRSSLFERHAGRPTRTVCSTMIAEAFGYIQFPILPLVEVTADQQAKLFRRNPKLCAPRDFDYSPYFDIIKYPFIDASNYGDHRLLPWHNTTPATGLDGSAFGGPIPPQAGNDETPPDDALVSELTANGEIEPLNDGQDELMEEIKTSNEKATQDAGGLNKKGQSGS